MCSLHVNVDNLGPKLPRSRGPKKLPKVWDLKVLPRPAALVGILDVLQQDTTARLPAPSVQDPEFLPADQLLMARDSKTSLHLSASLCISLHLSALSCCLAPMDCSSGWAAASCARTRAGSTSQAVISSIGRDLGAQRSEAAKPRSRGLRAKPRARPSWAGPPGAVVERRSPFEKREFCKVSLSSFLACACEFWRIQAAFSVPTTVPASDSMARDSWDHGPMALWALLVTTYPMASIHRSGPRQSGCA